MEILMLAPLYPVRCPVCRHRLRSVATGYPNVRDDTRRWCRHCKTLCHYKRHYREPSSPSRRT